MKGFYSNIEKDTLENQNFRQVLFTGEHSQLVLMTLQAGEEIGAEIHDNIDQFLRFEKGEGKVVIDDEEYKVKDGDAVIVPAGAKHNVINTSSQEALHLYTIYAPPEHPAGTVHKNKAEADAYEADHHH